MKKDTKNKTINSLPNAKGLDGLSNVPTRENEFIKIKTNSIKIIADAPDFVWQIVAVLQNHFYIVPTSKLIPIENEQCLLFCQIFPKEGNTPQTPRSFSLELKP